MSAMSESKSVAVRTLVEFAAKAGSLDRRFTPAPSGQQGIQGHKTVTARRHSQYQSEYQLELQHQGLLLRGRADGYDPLIHRMEEIKTHYGDALLIPKNHQQLHWAQLKIYGWMYCKIYHHTSIGLALVYLDLHLDKETIIDSNSDLDELAEFAHQIIDFYNHWHKAFYKRQEELSFWIKTLSFPYATMHASQRRMAELVYKAAALKRTLMVEAPTGTGKTLASLFPAIKSLHYTGIDKIFYLTAKSTAKQLAIDAIELITSNKATPLRSLELTAQKKICLEPAKECHGESCHYALDFYDKLQRAREAASHIPLLDQVRLVELAKNFSICPFYLGMEMARWVDIVIADVNYFVDGTPLLLALTEEFDWQPILLVDEAHNMIERGREIFSAELNRNQLLAARKLSPKSLQKPFGKLNKEWVKLIDLHNIHNVDSKFIEYQIIHQLPNEVLQSVMDLGNRITEYLQANPTTTLEPPVMELFFDILHFQHIAEMLDDDYLIELLKQDGDQIGLRNMVPAKQLAARFQYAAAACFFSATLTPPDFYQQLLGLPDDTVIEKLPSPFDPMQLQIKIAKHISTRYQHRQTSLQALCKIICEQLKSHPGNAILFTSSYTYLQMLEAKLVDLLKDMNIKLLIQKKNMTEHDRENFLREFDQTHNLLGLAVLGGVFSEGIDLPGEKLKGVFIATLGLPQVNSFNERLAQHLQSRFERGYDYTYLYPGIQKVVQAAGRVIRTTNDQGYVMLLDQRFQQLNVKTLFPEWWEFDS